MKTVNEEKYFKSNLGDSVKKHVFSVENDAAIMKRLSDNVYSDPIRAIIREISANAYDAHVENGIKEVPFDLKLPTTDDSEIKFRDYGKGLSEESLVNVFTRYGKSTKRDSDELVGGIGIGCKSPFAYTDQFTVISYHEERKITAICSKDNIGLPFIMILSNEEQKGVRSGLELSFPVSQKDCDVFKEKAQSVLKWFDVQPNTNLELDYTKNILVETENFILIHSNYPEDINVLMGGIVYENNNRLGNIRHEKNITLKAAIGDLDINMSRESIQTNDGNCIKINQKFESFDAEVGAKIQEELNKKQDIKEAIQFLRKIYSSNNISKFCLYDGLTVSSRGVYAISFSAVTVSAYGDRYNTVINPDDNENKTYIYRDIKVGFVKACVEAIKQKKVSEFILIEGSKEDFLKTGVVKPEELLLCSSFYQKPLRKKPNPHVVSKLEYGQWVECDASLLDHSKCLRVEIYRGRIESPDHRIKSYLSNSTKQLIPSDFTVIGIKKGGRKKTPASLLKIQTLEDYLKNRSLTVEEKEIAFAHIFCENLYSGMWDIKNLVQRLEPKYKSLLLRGPEYAKMQKYFNIPTQNYGLIEYLDDKEKEDFVLEVKLLKEEIRSNYEDYKNLFDVLINPNKIRDMQDILFSRIGVVDE
jgi:hypothetical protein